MQPNQQNPYDFILSSSPRPERPPLVGGTAARALVVVVGVVIVIIIGSVLFSTLTAGDKEQRARLIEIARAQSELVRISDLGIKPESALTQDTRTYSISIKLTTSSDQKVINNLIVQRGVSSKGLAKAIGASKNPKTDEALKEATQNNRFDETYKQIMTEQLANYQILMQAAYDSGTSIEKERISQPFQNNEKILAYVSPPVNEDDAAEELELDTTE